MNLEKRIERLEQQAQAPEAGPWLRLIVRKGETEAGVLDRYRRDHPGIDTPNVIFRIIV